MPTGGEAPGGRGEELKDVNRQGPTLERMRTDMGSTIAREDDLPPWKGWEYLMDLHRKERAHVVDDMTLKHRSGVSSSGGSEGPIFAAPEIPGGSILAILVLLIAALL